MENVVSFREKVKASYLASVLVATGIVSAVSAVLISYPALAYLASRIG